MNTPINILRASSVQTEIVVDSNPEFADLSNPHGFIYDFAFLVQAETASGRRFHHRQTFQDEREAQAFAKTVGQQGTILPQDWLETYPIYGSSAWEGEDRERQVLLQDAIARNDQEAIEVLS
jgi:hypothetical protein